MIEIDRVLHERFKAAGADTYRKFLCSEVIHNWDKLFDKSISAQVKPVTIEHGVLFVSVSNSAFKDQLKFYTEEIIDIINESYDAEETLVKEIRLAKGFQIANMPPKETEPAPVEKPKVSMEEITLTDEEIKDCEEKASKISDAELRQTVLSLALSHARSQKFKLANGWHKCAECNVLCEPEEMFCESCKIKAREKMVKELKNIFREAPQTKTHEAQKILLERMPYMRNECIPEAIESARTSLIQEIANTVRFGDADSPDVEKLVALEKRLPLDKLTPAIIQRTLLDMHFNLLDGALVRRYNVLNPSRK